MSNPTLHIFNGRRKLGIRDCVSPHVLPFPLQRVVGKFAVRRRTDTDQRFALRRGRYVNGEKRQRTMQITIASQLVLGKQTDVTSVSEDRDGTRRCRQVTARRKPKRAWLVDHWRVG